MYPSIRNFDMPDPWSLNFLKIPSNAPLIDKPLSVQWPAPPYKIMKQ